MNQYDKEFRNRVAHSCTNNIKILLKWTNEKNHCCLNHQQPRLLLAGALLVLKLIYCDFLVDFWCTLPFINASKWSKGWDSSCTELWYHQQNKHADISIPTVKSRFRDNDTTLLTLTSHFFAKFVPQDLNYRQSLPLLFHTSISYFPHTHLCNHLEWALHHERCFVIL